MCNLNFPVVIFLSSNIKKVKSKGKIDFNDILFNLVYPKFQPILKIIGKFYFFPYTKF